VLQVISVDGSKSLETIVFALGVLPIAMVAIAIIFATILGKFCLNLHIIF
jgi:hypothetical protein